MHTTHLVLSLPILTKIPTHVMAHSFQIEQFQCPISLSIFADPVFAEDGYTYERSCIATWLTQHKYSPMTKKEMGSRLIGNMMMRSMIAELLESDDKLKDQQFVNQEVIKATPLIDTYAKLESSMANREYTELLKYRDFIYDSRTNYRNGPGKPQSFNSGMIGPLLQFLNI